MATALTGAHFAQPTAATLAPSCESRTAAAAPLTPTAPINEPPNHAAAPRSCRERTTVFREDIEILAMCLRRGRPKVAPAELGSAWTGRNVMSTGAHMVRMLGLGDLKPHAACPL